MKLRARGAWGRHVRLVGAQTFLAMGCRGASHVTAARFGWVLREKKCRILLEWLQWDLMQVVSALEAALQRRRHLSRYGGASPEEASALHPPACAVGTLPELAEQSYHLITPNRATPRTDQVAAAQHWGDLPEGSWGRRAWAAMRSAETAFKAASLLNFLVFLRYGHYRRAPRPVAHPLPMLAGKPCCGDRLMLAGRASRVPVARGVVCLVTAA